MNTGWILGRKGPAITLNSSNVNMRQYLILKRVEDRVTLGAVMQFMGG
jgi:hypothetical protein